MDEIKTPPVTQGAATKGAGKRGERKKGANKEGRAQKIRLREVRAERQGLMKTIHDAKARKVVLDTEMKALRAAAPPKTPKAT